MFGAYGAALPPQRPLRQPGRNRRTALAGLARPLAAVRGAASGKRDLVNDALPKIESIETYEVRADGELLTSEQADVLPLAQGKLLFRRDQGSGIRAGD